MSVLRTDDPAADWQTFCDENEERAKKYPICSCCGQHIFDYIYRLDGEIYCDDCALDWLKKQREEITDD